MSDVQAADAAAALENAPPDTDKVANAREKEKLRKAGEDYFSKLLKEAGSSRAKTAAQRSATLREQRPRRKDVEDPDLVAVGMVIEGSKFYILAFVYVCCHAVGMVCMKESLEHLETPALLAFCHQLPVMACLWALSLHGSLDLRGLSTVDLQACIPGAVCTGLALIATLATLIHGDLLIVVAYMAMSDVLLDVVIGLYLRRDAALVPSSSQKGALTAAAGALFLLVVVRPQQGAFTLFMLALWTVVRVAHEAWRCVCSCPDLACTLLGEERGSGLRALAASAASVEPAAQAFLSHALSALPVLALGFLFHEGSELMEHEISVPSLSIILMSCCCFAATECSRLLISPGLTKAAHNFVDSFYIGVVLVLVNAQSSFSVVNGFASTSLMLCIGAGLAAFRHRTTASDSL